MKYSEFNKKLYEFELQYSDSVVYVYCDGIMVGVVSKEYRYCMSTGHEGFEKLPEKVAFMVYENMMMLAETPLADREEEKRYRLRKIPIPLLGEKDNLYYNFPKVPYFEPCADADTEETELWTSIFTESEIAQMDITGFEKIEVEK